MSGIVWQPAHPRHVGYSYNRPLFDHGSSVFERNQGSGEHTRLPARQMAAIAELLAKHHETF